MNPLEQFRKMTMVVADTGNFLQMAIDATAAEAMVLPNAHFDEAQFRYALNDDVMATDKSAQGIRLFAADAVKLEKPIEGVTA